MRFARALVPAVVVLGLTGCGSGSDTLDGSSEAGRLHGRVEAMRSALTDGNIAAARDSLSSFRADVRKLADAGAINDDDAAMLLLRTERISAGIDRQAAAAKPTPAPALDLPVLDELFGDDEQDEEDAGPGKKAKGQGKKKGKDD